METLFGLSICALCVLSIIMMMIIKNLTRQVYRNSKEVDSLRESLHGLQWEHDNAQIGAHMDYKHLSKKIESCERLLDHVSCDIYNV